MAKRMKTDKDMKELWESGMVFFNHLVKLRHPPTLKTLKDAFDRAVAFLLPDGFPGADIIIPVKIPGLKSMTFCAVQVKNRKHDTFTSGVKTEAMSSLKKAIDALEWSQNHIALMMCLRYKPSPRPSAKSSPKPSTEPSTKDKKFDILLPKEVQRKRARGAPSAGDTEETRYKWPSKTKRLVVFAMDMKESVYPSINLFWGGSKRKTVAKSHPSWSNSCLPSQKMQNWIR